MRFLASVLHATRQSPGVARRQTLSSERRPWGRHFNSNSVVVSSGGRLAAIVAASPK